MHDSIKGLYIPPNEYCACDALHDEWMNLMPNVVECNDRIEHLIMINKS